MRPDSRLIFSLRVGTLPVNARRGRPGRRLRRRRSF